MPSVKKKNRGKNCRRRPQGEPTNKSLEDAALLEPEMSAAAEEPLPSIEDSYRSGSRSDCRGGNGEYMKSIPSTPKRLDPPPTAYRSPQRSQGVRATPLPSSPGKFIPSLMEMKVSSGPCSSRRDFIAGTSTSPFLTPMQENSFTGFPLASVDLSLNQLQRENKGIFPVQGRAAALGQGGDFKQSRKGSSSDESLCNDPLFLGGGSPAPEIKFGETWGTPGWNPWQTFDLFPEVPERFDSLKLPNPFEEQNSKRVLNPRIYHTQEIHNEAALERALLSPFFNVGAFGTTDDVESSSKPGIFVMPQMSVNFAGLVIQFSIRVFNIPPGCTVLPHMFDGIVETPSGDLIPCSVKNDFANSTELFLGSFKATNEVGTYQLRVRLVLPFDHVDHREVHHSTAFGVMGDVEPVVVSRNYFKESQRTPSTTFQLVFQTQEDRHGTENENKRPKAWGLDCDLQANRIYYSERAANQVSCLDPTTGVVLFRFNQSKPESRLNRPTGICCDRVNRRVIVCDKDNHRISFFSMDGEYISSFGCGGYLNGMFSYPWDVAADPFGDYIAVADSRNKRVQLFDRAGHFLAKYSVFERNPFEYKKNFDYPRGVTFDHQGKNVYVTDFNTQNVIELPISFVSAKRICPEGKLRRPQGIVVDEIGNMLLADSKNHCIRHLTVSGQHLCTIHSIGHSFVEYPVNVALMPDGRLAVLDGKAKIHIF